MSKFAFQYQGDEEDYKGKYIYAHAMHWLSKQFWTTVPSEALSFDTYEQALKHHFNSKLGSWMKIVEVGVDERVAAYDRAMRIV